VDHGDQSGGVAAARGAVREALRKLDLLVISENVFQATIPSTLARIYCYRRGMGREDGTVTNSERRISRQRPFLPLPARPSQIGGWWGQVACRMGFAEAFDFNSAADVFREHAALSAFENDGSRDFDIGAWLRSAT